MASVGSLTSSTSSSIRGYGGLASGLDRDELIEGMTIGTRTKINQQEQKKQKIEWMQEAVRTISDKMISFHGKYTETLTSSSNLFSSVLWGRNKITTSGANSKYVAVSGTASGADAMTIMAVKQRAQNASLSSSGMASDSVLRSGEIDVDQTYLDLRGKTLEFSYKNGSTTVNHSITIDGVFKSEEEAAKYIQDRLNERDFDKDSGKKLGDYVQVSKKSGGAGFTIAGTVDTPSGFKLTGGTALGTMGITQQLGADSAGAVLSNTASVTSDLTVLNTKSFKDMVAGQSLTFSYNGTEAQISIDKAATLDEAKDSLQKSLDAKFGKDRITVEKDGNKLTFKTTVPGETGADGKNIADTSSTLKITGGSDDALMALGLSRGLTNRTNLDAKISTEGFTKFPRYFDADGNEVVAGTAGATEENWFSFKLNGADVNVKEGATVRDLMNAINKSGANVTVSYQEAADKFTFTSKVDGASGVIDFKTGNTDSEIFGTLGKTFGLDSDTIAKETVRGQDAIVAVKYAGSDEEVELRRGTNSFSVDGLTFTLKGEFGYKRKENGELEVDKDGNAIRDRSTDPVEINAEVDVDRVLSTIKSFVEDYNAIVDMVNTELTTKHDRDYDPLSSEQKSELSDSEVEKWEAKAKAGLLYGDSDLRNLSMDLRVVVSGGNLIALQNVGISVSSNYADNGKLSIDETKLRAALETNPESVEKLFTSTNGVDANGNETFNGLATNLKNVMNKYVKTTGPMEDKGVLIRKAGSKSAALSLTQNYYYDQLTGINKLLDTLNDRLKTEQDRYISQFSSLETLINNMNSQSSYLSSMF